MDKHTILIGGSLGRICPPEEWEAPDGPTAERWRDEVNARGGAAEIRLLADGTGANCRYFVRIMQSGTARQSADRSSSRLR